MNQKTHFFNVFKFDNFLGKNNDVVDFRIRNYHKIMLVKGNGEFLHSDKIIKIEEYALIFANPKLNHKWRKRELLSQGFSCVFDTDFLIEFRSIGFHPFKLDENYIVNLNEDDFLALSGIFDRMLLEISSDYIYKYHLLKMLVYEIMHFALKLESDLKPTKLASKSAEQICTNFTDLLERQFPIDDPIQSVSLLQPHDFAKKLFIHVNHLNRSVKTIKGKTTSEVIKERFLLEARTLLLQTNWTITQISDCLGYSEPTHFCKFFKKQLKVTPKEFRHISYSP